MFHQVIILRSPPRRSASAASSRMYEMKVCIPSSLVVVYLSFLASERSRRDTRTNFEPRHA